jgi:NAD(P)-dependent dehydrogenase (short-subunit alcohol dehydrogenase family)
MDCRIKSGNDDSFRNAVLPHAGIRTGSRLDMPGGAVHAMACAAKTAAEGSPMGKTAIVTGAGSGIGRAVAKTLLKAGYSVVLAGRRREALDGTAEGAGERALVVPTDVTDPESVAALVKATVDAFGRLDLLFNNAGQNTPSTPFDEVTDEQWRSIVDVNLSGMFYCARQAVRQMKRQDPRGGRIINNGSISAHAPRPGSAPYTATKHGVTGLTKSISLDCRAFDIACGQIDIGNAVTEMAERMAEGVPQANGTIATEPLMDVQNVADTVLHMDSLPLDANVLFVTVMANRMPFVGRG